MKLTTNKLNLLEYISNNGQEIETLFVERIAQLLKPDGIAAVLLTSTILNKDETSYIKSREVLLQNFMIKAIVQLGSKTFSATNFSTVIMFLQKYDEPPKRTDLVSDSVAAIWKNEDLSGWEDNEILSSYLEKIGVTYDDYSNMVSGLLDYIEWEKHSYFKQYYDAFVSSTEYAKKTAQKTFKKLSEDEQLEWLNQRFYDLVESREKEKIYYYSLVYKQNTLIILSPKNVKEQEKFLGYKWEGRKGHEGIKITNPGGLLYDADNSGDGDNASVLIHSMYNNERAEAPSLEECYYYLRLQDMIDFGKVQFTKTIKTSKVRTKKPKEGYSLYSLSSKTDFESSIGKRVLQSEIEEKGVPVYSANIFDVFGYTSKSLLKDFKSPSILWGIDGDWMVNVLPSQTAFYPTDHCGVLRVKNKKILPEYVALALEVEGRYEDFSRNYRASLQRVRDLSILVPDEEVQKKILAKFTGVDKSIHQSLDKLQAIEKEIMDNFLEIFGDIYSNPKHFPTKSFGVECCKLNPEKPSSFALSDDEEVSFVQMPSVTSNGIVDATETRVLSAVRTGYTYFEENDVLFAKITPCMENGKGGIASKLKNGIGFGSTEFHVLRPIAGVSNSFCLYYVTMFKRFRSDAEENMTGASGHKRVQESFLNNFMIGLPSIKLQEKFADYASKKSAEKMVITIKLNQLNQKRDKLLHEYFD